MNITLKEKWRGAGILKVPVGDNFEYENYWIRRADFYKLSKNILAFTITENIKNDGFNQWFDGDKYPLKFSKEKYVRVAFKKLKQLSSKGNVTDVEGALRKIIYQNLKVLGFEPVEISAITRPNSISEDMRLEKHFGILHLVGSLQKEYNKLNNQFI